MTETFGETLRRQARVAQETRLAGICGQTMVRAGMDPRYDDETARDHLVQSILSTRLPGSVQVAAAAITGWVIGHPEPVCTCPMIPTGPAEWDPDAMRWRHPHHREWSWDCKVLRHRDYKLALFRRTETLAGVS